MKRRRHIPGATRADVQLAIRVTPALRGRLVAISDRHRESFAKHFSGVLERYADWHEQQAAAGGSAPGVPGGSEGLQQPAAPPAGGCSNTSGKETA